MSSDENDWKLNICRREFALQIETASSGKSHIEHQARGSIRARAAQEFRNGRQRLHAQTH